MNRKISIRLLSLGLCLAFLGCGGTAQSFLQKSGAAHQKVEQKNWSNEPSAEASDWTTYMDLEH